MQCHEASELMSLRLDADLQEAEELALHEHLAGCDHCASEWQLFQRLDLLLAQEGLVAPSSSFARRVMGHIRRRSVWLSLARGALLLLLGLVILSALASSWLIGSRSVLMALLSNTPLLNALVGALVRLLAILSTLAGAVRLFWRALLSSPCWVVLAGYTILAGLLTLWWLRLIARPARAVSRQRAPS